MSNEVITKIGKQTLIQNICRDYLITRKSLKLLCEEVGITTKKFYQYVTECGLEDKINSTVDLSVNVHKDAQDMEKYANIPETVFTRFMYIANEYSTNLKKDIAACVKDVKTTKAMLYDWMSKYPIILKPIWAAAKEKRREMLHIASEDNQLDMAKQALETIYTNMKPSVMIEETSRKGQVVVGGQVQQVDETTTKKKQVKGDLKAAQLALETLGLRDKKINVTHKFETIEVVPAEDIEAIQDADAKLLEQLNKKSK